MQTYEVLGGDLIDDVCAHVAALSQSTHDSVTFEFSGVTIVVPPDSSTSDALFHYFAQYNSARASEPNRTGLDERDVQYRGALERHFLPMLRAAIETDDEPERAFRF